MASGVDPVSFIYAKIAEGTGSTQALREYREAGGSIRTQRFYQAFGEVELELATRGLVEAAPVDRAPTPQELTPRTTSRPGGYLYRVGVLTSRSTVDPITGQVREQTSIEWQSIRTAQLIDYAQAMAEAEANFGTGSEAGPYGGSVVGSFVSAVNELVPEDDLGV